MNTEQQAKAEEFIRKHLKRSTAEVALILSKTDLPKNYILRQINGRQKAVQKFPFLSDHPSYLYPPPISVSQASSEVAAKYKAGIVSKSNAIADLSGGMGIDSYFLSKKSKKLDYVEKKEELCRLAQTNFNTLSANNIKVHNEDAKNFIENSSKKYDLLYLDPDRRNESKRLINIADCSPDLSSIIDSLFNKSDKILIKYSPALDIHAGKSDLKHVKEVHILSIDNECKELLFYLEKGFAGESKRIAADISSSEERIFEFYYSEEKEATSTYSNIGQFLYEPNAAIMKAAAFGLIGNKYGLSKIAGNTHLYTSHKEVFDFPGRILKTIETSKDASSLCKKANIVSRNSGLSVEQIKKKYKIQEGGEQFLYAYKNSEGKREFALCERR